MAFFTEVVKVTGKFSGVGTFGYLLLLLLLLLVLLTPWPMRPMLTHEPLMCSLVDDAFEDWLCFLTVATQQVVQHCLKPLIMQL